MRRWMLSLAVLAACAADPTQLVVVVDSDMDVPVELDAVTLKVTDPDGTVHDASVSLGAGEDLPRTLVLLYRGGELGPVRVSARGLRSGVEVVHRSASTSFLSGQTRVLRVDLLRECVGMICPESQSCAAGGCRDESVPPSELAPWTGTPPPLPNSDAGRAADSGVDSGMDSGVDSGMDSGADSSVDGTMDACVSTSEVCNGLDDDCDGVADNGFEVAIDPLNCGACGVVCPTPANTTPTCAAGACGFACATGFVDCNGNPADGCEADLSSVRSCGACGLACDIPFATEACDMGVCIIASCAAGRADCDTVRSNGCEVDVASSIDHCGDCTTACPASPANGASVCAAGSCALVCDPGFADCDGLLASGCEASLSSPLSCGACGTLCSSPTPACDATGCVSGCPLGQTDCGGGVCADLQSSVSHCGACGTMCAAPANAAAGCATGACSFICDAGFGDCNGLDIDGCEASLTTLTDCGACGAICAPANAVGACGATGCTIASCSTGFADCNGDPADGCEADLNTAMNCGACGMVCSLAHATNTCPSGRCEIGSCDAGFADCNGRRRDGCERDLTSSVGDCGACGAVCPSLRATPVCSAFACSVNTPCDPGFADCNGNLTDGCETNVASLANCGGCGVMCAGDACVGGSCLTTADVVVQVAAGQDFACARRRSGVVECWGRNNKAQLGDGGTVDRFTPAPVTSITDAVDISVGASHACAVRMTGDVLCWGDNGSGQLGDGSRTRATTPVLVLQAAAMPLAGATAVAAGKDHSCAIAAGGLYCWGKNRKGQLGDNTTVDHRFAQAVMWPVGVAAPSAVAAGNSFSCGLAVSGDAYCWGDNGNGQLGDGTSTRRLTPAAVSGIASGVEVMAGDAHACVRLGSGQVWCWGDNGAGQLGDGSTSRRSLPVMVSGLTSASSLACGKDQSCAIDGSGQVWCWGAGGAGALGDGLSADSSTPVMASGLTDGLDVAAGKDFSLAARTAGGAMAWGANGSGQLGDGTTTSSALPVPVSRLP